MSALGTLDLAGIRARAEAATPGPWFVTGDPWFRSNDGVLAGSPDGNIAFVIADCEAMGPQRDEYEGPFKLSTGEADASYIAGMDPLTTLALVDEVERQAGELSRAVSSIAGMTSRAVAAEAEVERLTRERDEALHAESEAHVLREQAVIRADDADRCHEETGRRLGDTIDKMLTRAETAEAEVVKLRARVAELTAAPAFRAWHNALRIPSGIDRDELLAAGVIADDEDWLCWRDRGWLPFIIKATDAQAAALFGLVQERLELGRRPMLLAAGTPIVCPRGHRVGTAAVDILGPNLRGGLHGDIFLAAMIDLADGQAPLVDARRGVRRIRAACHCGAPWGWYGSLLTEKGWSPPLSDNAKQALARRMRSAEPEARS